MTEKHSPWLDASYGWNLGESGWNVGMDENINKFSFLLNAGVTDIVSSIPATPATIGESYYLSTDNRFYFAVDGAWQQSSCPVGFVFRNNMSGNYYEFDGASLNQVSDLSQVQQSLDSLDNTVQSLGTAAFQDSSEFAPSASVSLIIPDVSTLRTTAGRFDGDRCSLLSYYSGVNRAGGGNLTWYASSALSDNSATVFKVAGVPTGAWIRDDKTIDLYQCGGTFEGDCINAFDRAVALTDVTQIKVPDNVVLGYHTIDCDRKIIYGGKNVSFSTYPSGFYPRVCNYIEIREFKDISMAMHPITGGDIATAQLFVGTAPAANIRDITVCKNTGSGGRLAISLSFEGGGRTLTGQVLIYENEFVDQQGQAGGEGYGIHVANETDTGNIFVMRNKITRAGRHSFYFARNRGGGRMVSWANTAIDHRYNATTKGTEQRGAIQITRSKNVLSIGDMVDGYFDGAMQISEENESPGTFDAADVTVRDPVLRKPYNNTPGIYVGYGVPFAGTALTKGILIDGLRYYAGDSLAPAVQFTRGRNVRVVNSHIEYLNVTSGAIRPIQILGNTTTDSGNLLVKDTFVYCRGCSGANLRVFRLTGNCLTSNIPIDLDGVVMDSDAATNQALDPSGTITNTQIKVSGMAVTGWTGATWPLSRQDPSQVWNGQFITSGITTPVGNVVPNFIGQDLYIQGNGTFWKAFGLTNTSWKQTA